MKKVLFVVIAIALMVSCSNKKNNQVDSLVKEAEKIEKAMEDAPTAKTVAKKIFNVKSGYVKYKSLAAGMEMTREMWFDDYGTLQYEENYMIMMGQKTGSSAIVRDGYRYDWSFNTNEGTKNKFYTAEYVEFENVSKEDIERYKMKDHGYETIAGKKCRKVSVEKPVVATTWTWEGLPIKTTTQFAGNDVIMEALEVREEAIPASRFEIPSGITFTEM